MSEKRKPNAAWMPPAWEPSDAAAIQALCRGDADAGQQQRALKWIIESACATYDLAYRPESARDTDFSLGRQFVGQQIVKLTKLNLGKLQKDKTA